MPHLDEMITSAALFELLGPSVNGDELKASILSGVPAFQRGRSVSGRSAPVEIQSTGKSLLVTRAHLEILCLRYLKGEIDDVELEYVANMLDLCPDFVYDESVADAIFAPASPEINGGISRAGVKRVLLSLGESL
jgi:hypothetical protein